MANRREVETLIALHELMRRDARRLVTRLESPTVEPTDLAALARWFRVYRSALTQHHEVEDHVLFPAAERHGQGSASVRGELESQHDQLDLTLDRLDAALGGNRATEAVTEARALVDVLDEHLDLEEEWLVPLANQLSDAEFKAVDRAAARMHPMGESLMYLGWMIDGFDESERENFFAWQPRSVRVFSALSGPGYRRRARAAGMLEEKTGSKRRFERPRYTNTLGLPDALVPLIERTFVCEYASNKADGTPVTAALSPVPGIDGPTIDVDTAAALPLKAERARRDPRVCLLFSEPAALPGDRPPVALVHGRATVRDADLQANLDRSIAVQLAISRSFRQIPGFVLRRMAGYLARIRIEITPEKILWWPDGDLDQPPEQWEAPPGTVASPSDPPPTGPRPEDTPLVTVDADPVASVRDALNDLGSPILTAPDADGYPVPFRTAGGSLEGGVVHLALHPHTPARLDGRACLSFHTVEIKKDDIVANENRTYLGSVVFDGDRADFTIERQLPTINLRTGLQGNLALLKLNRGLKARLGSEAARRGQPVPTVRLPDS